MALHNPPLLLIAPDNPDRPIMGEAASLAGFAVQVADTGNEGLTLLRLRAPDVVLVHLGITDMDGLSLVRSIREEAPEAALLIVTARASLEGAVEAIRLGVRDYLQSPLDLGRVQQLLAAHHDAAMRRRVHLFPAERSPAVAFHSMIGRSLAMQRLFRLLRQMAPHIHTGLITGETGTGKELVARALHRLGPRADRRFVVINCSAVVESLFESELFGHVRGAFTGATDSKAGLFELADGGTLFLDEVGELPSGVQAKLLRAIEYGEILRVGSLEPRRVDVQILAATNRDLETQCDAGRFRRDLYYRLNVVEVHVPALRERRDDIAYLAAHFMREMATRFAKPLSGLSAGGERLLRGADWQGNVRELRNVMERACLLTEGALVGEAEVRASLPVARRPVLVPPLPVSTPPPTVPVREHPGDEALDTQPLSDMEREAIVRALRRANGNKKVAATMLGVSRRALYRRLERLDLGRTIVRRGEGAA